MKRFDEISIFNRLQQRMMVHEDWATIIGQGTIGNLLHTISEGNAELARYLEYLYNEKKWRNARNMSSLMHQADLIAYKRSLPKSAIGFVVVSHTDVEGKSRLPNYGTSFFDMDQLSDYDNLILNQNSTAMERAALVPWTADVGYIIPEGTIFKSGTGVSYFSIETIESRSLKEPYSAILANDIKYADFIKAGGWNGIKYVKVPVIQGERRSITFGIASGTRFESFAIDNLQIENASNIISEKYFKIKVTPKIISNGVPTDSITETWESIHNIRLAGPYDKVFEHKILNDENKVLIKFGDGITGQMLPKDATVSCEYLETDGLLGNLQDRFQIVEMTFPNGAPQVDPRFNTQTKFLECTNIVPIMGGKEIENEDNVRVSAPPSYLQSYSIATKASYLEQIIKNSPVNLLHCRIFQSNIYETESYYPDQTNSVFSSRMEKGVLQEVTIVKNALLITAIRANGSKIELPESELLDPLIKAFDDNTSPNDSFDYIEPNFVEIRPNIIVNTTETLTEDSIKNEIAPAILSKYSIFNTDFEKPYYKTDIIDIVQNYHYNKYSSIFLEAKASVNYAPTILTDRSVSMGPQVILDDANTLLAFRFNFDKIFAQNSMNAGLRNYTQKAPYLIRADLLLRNRPDENKSLFLFDNRHQLLDNLTIMDAELKPIKVDQNIPVIRDVKTYANFENVTLFDDYSPDFINQQSRTAQFNFIEKITSDSYVSQMKSFMIEPYENRPLLLDNTGKNKIFNVAEVKIEDRLSFNFDDNVVGQQCYRKNSQYINNAKIIFYENYNMPEDLNYAYGYVIVPLQYLLTSDERRQFITQFENTIELTAWSQAFSKFFIEQFTLNVYAQPVESEFNCENPFDIIFTNKDNILIQKNYLAANS